MVRETSSWRSALSVGVDFFVQFCHLLWSNDKKNMKITQIRSKCKLWLWVILIKIIYPHLSLLVFSPSWLINLKYSAAILLVHNSRFGGPSKNKDGPVGRRIYALAESPRCIGESKFTIELSWRRYFCYNFRTMQDSYVGIMYLMLMKASGPPRLSRISRVSWIRSPTFSWNLWW